jgi:hypothetical protein
MTTPAHSPSSRGASRAEFVGNEIASLREYWTCEQLN